MAMTRSLPSRTCFAVDLASRIWVRLESRDSKNRDALLVPDTIL